MSDRGMRRVVLVDYGEVTSFPQDRRAVVEMAGRVDVDSSVDALADRLGTCATATDDEAREHQS